MKNYNKNFTSKISNKLFLGLGLSLIFFINISAQNAAIIDLDNTHQIIRGFGAANILPWRPDMTNDEINTAFGTGDGQIGFSILRLRVPNQQSEFNLNVPTAQAAHSLGVTLIASPWSPPPEMKTNNDPVGGELDEAYYDDFAAHLNSFATYMAENDAPIYAISVQNEPDVHVGYESCDYNASQMLKFVKENSQSIGTKVMAPESADFDKQLSDPILNDSAACANLDIVAGHIYGGGLEPYPLAESRGKELWMTEHLQLGFSWVDALSTANDINDCLRAGMNAYIWWYIVRFYGPIDDGSGDYAKGEVTKRGYAMSQFARFIRPGYLRIESTGNPQNNIFTSAYIDSLSSKVVIVAINNSSQAIEQTFSFQNGNVEKFTPYVTSETKNCSQESDILVSNASFSASLNGESVTTFVSSGNVIVSIENSPSHPTSFKLYQNYPNPFNPSTRINFEIPEKSFVSLKVYNILGEVVAELAGKQYVAGVHSLTFDASHLASGIYFYTLRAGDFTQTKKMFLIR
jgi:glucuronoarabinoxylan endo-1,4-beta-xylanase